MRLLPAILMLLSLSAAAQDPSPSAEANWQAALRGDPRAIEAAQSLRNLLSDDGLGGLREHLPDSRIRMLLVDSGVSDRLYGREQATAILGAWMEPIRHRNLKISMAVLSDDASRLTLLLLWPPSSPEDLLPALGRLHHHLRHCQI